MPLRLNHERDRDVRRLLDVTARLFDRADDAYLVVMSVMFIKDALCVSFDVPFRVLDVEERDERTSARCSSGAVRELALLDGTTRRDRVRLRVLDQAPRGCWGVLLLDVEERGRDRRAAGRRQAAR